MDLLSAIITWYYKDFVIQFKRVPLVLRSIDIVVSSCNGTMGIGTADAHIAGEAAALLADAPLGEFGPGSLFVIELTMLQNISNV